MRLRTVWRNQDGFTYTEVIVSLVLLTYILLTTMNVAAFALATITASKARPLGLAVANEHIEYLRTLPYDSLATVNGPIYPPGTISDQQEVERDRYRFVVTTEIRYIDDEFDGNATGTVAGKPVDLFPYDYKQARVMVKFKHSGRTVAQLTSNFGAKAAETSSNTGILSIKVVDANGLAIADATVRITNNNPNPDVDITTTTDVNGVVVVPLMPPDSTNGYKIVASKAGFSTSETLADPAGAQTAVQPNVNVLVQQITNVTLAIDQLSSLTLQVNDPAGAAVAGLAVTVTGTKKNYTNPDVSKYSASHTTDATGRITIPALEWDSYSISVPGGHYVVTTSPYQPVAVNPGGATSATVVVSQSATHPTIQTVDPNTAATGAAVTITVSGTNLSTGTSLVLRQAGQADIAATGIATDGTSLSGTLDLTTAAVGNWDIIVSNGAGQAVQPGGYSVTP